MRILNRRKENYINEVADNYKPAVLPTPGRGLERESPSVNIESYVTSAYHMNIHENIEKAYENAEKELKKLIETGDHHSCGKECDKLIDGQIEKLYADLRGEIAEHNNQCIRLKATKQARIKILEDKILRENEEIEKQEKVIKPLEGLQSQFAISGTAIPVGVLITVVALIFDTIVNFSYFQSIITSNGVLLWMTVLGCSILSDVSMMALGIYISHKDQFTSKTMYYTMCFLFILMFSIAVVGTVLIRFGTMPETFASVDIDGNIISYEGEYSLAQWGSTILTSCVTAATGVLSFAFSNDKNSYSIKVREQAKRKLDKSVLRKEAFCSELILIQNSPDPAERDNLKKEAAIQEIEALRNGLKMHCRKILALHIGEASFTEKMMESNEALWENVPQKITAKIQKSKMNESNLEQAG